MRTTMTSERHLTDPELFALAAPAAGEPEALPAHLSHCGACSRALQEWKDAMRELSREDVGELEARTPEQWRAKETATMAAILHADRTGRPRHPLRWAIGVAASLAILALAMPRRDAKTVVAPASSASASASTLSPADQEDDMLLRDAAYLARNGDDASDLAMEESL